MASMGRSSPLSALRLSNTPAPLSATALSVLSSAQQNHQQTNLLPNPTNTTSSHGGSTTNPLPPHPSKQSQPQLPDPVSGNESLDNLAKEVLASMKELSEEEQARLRGTLHDMDRATTSRQVLKAFARADLSHIPHTLHPLHGRVCEARGGSRRIAKRETKSEGEDPIYNGADSRPIYQPKSDSRLSHAHGQGNFVQGRILPGKLSPTALSLSSYPTTHNATGTTNPHASSGQLPPRTTLPSCPSPQLQLGPGSRTALPPPQPDEDHSPVKKQQGGVDQEASGSFSRRNLFGSHQQQGEQEASGSFSRGSLLGTIQGLNNRTHSTSPSRGQSMGQVNNPNSKEVGELAVLLSNLIREPRPQHHHHHHHHHLVGGSGQPAGRPSNLPSVAHPTPETSFTGRHALMPSSTPPPLGRGLGAGTNTMHHIHSLASTGATGGSGSGGNVSHQHFTSINGSGSSHHHSLVPLDHAPQAPSLTHLDPSSTDPADVSDQVYGAILELLSSSKAGGTQVASG